MQRSVKIVIKNLNRNFMLKNSGVEFSTRVVEIDEREIELQIWELVRLFFFRNEILVFKIIKLGWT
jgi:hypothetical protein